VLGPITVGGVLPGAPQVRRLLAELLVHRNRPVLQDTLVDALWDGAPPPAAVSAFQSKVSRLRRLLAPDELRSTPAGYVLSVVPGDLDMDEFERLAVSAGDARAVADATTAALALWSGNAFEAAASDVLVEPVAQHLELLRRRTMQRRVDALIELGEHELAVTHARALIAEDEFAEEPRAALIRSLALSGRKVESLRAFTEFRRHLADETGLNPTPFLRALEQAVLADEIGPSRRLPAGVPLDTSNALTLRVRTPVTAWRGRIAANGQIVGRSPLTSAMRSWMTGALNGEPSTVAIIGPAGAGKSAALHELAREAQRVDRPARLFRSRTPSQPLFLPLRDLAEPAMSAGTSSAMLVSAQAYAYRILQLASDHGGLAVAFDDLHAADPGTVEVAAALVDAICSTTEPTPLVAVMTARPPESGSELDQLLGRMAREPSHHHWVLQPLGEASIHALVRARTGLDPTPALIDVLRRCSGGIPFGAIEALRLLRDRGDVQLTRDGRLHAPATTLVTTVGDLSAVTLETVREFSDGARRLLAMVCTIDASSDDLRVLVGLEPDVFDAAVYELRTALDVDVVSADPRRRPHDLTRAALRLCIDPDLERDAHRRAAAHVRPMAAMDDSAAAAFVEHALRIDLADDPMVAIAAQRVGDAAMASMRWADAALAFDVVLDRRPGLAEELQAGLAQFRHHDAIECRRHLTAAVAMAGEAHDLRAEATAMVMLQRAELTLAIGASSFDEAALIDGARRWRDAAPGMTVEALALAAEGAFHAGRHRDGLALIEAAAVDLRRDDAETLAALTALEFARGLCLLGVIELSAATEAFDRAREHAEAADDAWRLAWALGRLALTWLHRGEPAESLRWCERARAIERPTSNWAELAVVETIAASALAAAGEVDAASDAATDALALTRRSSYIWTRVPSMTVLLYCAVERGDAALAVAILDDIATVAGPRAAHPWAELVGGRLAGVPAPAEQWMMRTDADRLDIRHLTGLGLWTAIQRGRGTSEVVPMLAGAVAAGARLTLGWPFDLRRLVTSSV